VYILAMLASSAAGRGLVHRAALAAGLSPGRVIVSPVAIDPLQRIVSLEVPGGYRVGTMRWRTRPAIPLAPAFIPRNDRNPLAVAAARSSDGSKFLVWARFPYFDVQRDGDVATVTIRDARYPGEFGSWASARVKLPARSASLSP
jgi:hypothetical protein